MSTMVPSFTNDKLDDQHERLVHDAACQIEELLDRLNCASQVSEARDLFTTIEEVAAKVSRRLLNSRGGGL